MCYALAAMKRKGLNMDRRLKYIFLPLPMLALTLSIACQSASSSDAADQISSRNKNIINLNKPSIVLTPVIPKAHQDEVPELDEEYGIAYRKRYSNYVYAYSIEIPQGLVGFSDPDPQPKHGIGITLSKHPKSYLWIDSSYNAIFLESLDAAINQHLEWLAEDRAGVEVLRREKTHLQKLPAMRLVARYKSFATGEIRVQDLIVAFRPYEDDERGITYTIGLIAPESRYNEDVRVLERIINGWRMKPLPRA